MTRRRRADGIDREGLCARAARDVAHGAMQVFGGIAFTAEHPAHRYLRRIIVREQQFGDAAHHERELGRALASARRSGGVTGFDDPTAQRLEASPPAPSRSWSGRCSRRRSTTRAGRRATWR